MVELLGMTTRKFGKYIIIAVFFAAVILLGAAVLKMNGVFVAKNTNESFFDEIKRKITNQNQVLSAQTCKVKDSIDYFFYTNPPEQKQRNNKFGLYVYAESGDYLKLAQKLVNSNGGDWGYVLIPFNVNDKDYDKWRGVFDTLFERHLIPIIQLWNIDPKNYEDKTIEAANFLDKFVWPIKQRYVSVYNEPNDAAFWKGKINPQEYADILDFTIKTFKKQNSDFFMLNGAFNISAPTEENYLDAFTFMYLMNQKVPGVFSELDGWASHSYPQPNFSGSPYAIGRMSIKAYETELDYLKNNLGVKKDLPVFITETGWAHAEGKYYNSSYLPEKTVTDSLKKAFTDIWLKDDRVIAVTPFTIYYKPPFDHFSWVNEDNVPYEQYNEIKSLKKVAGNPAKLDTGTVDQTTCN